MKSLARRLIYFILYFIAFTIAINAIYLVIIAKTDWNFSKRIKSLSFDNPDYELLVLGTSLADYGLDTKLLTDSGIKSYNLALVGSSVKTCYIQLEEYLNRYKLPPKYVMLPVNAYLERFDQEGIQPVVEFTMKSQKINFKDIPLSKFNWQTTEIVKKIFSKEYRNGYVCYGQTRRQKLVPDHTSVDSLSLEINQYEEAVWIGEVAKLCRLNDITFILIEIPGVKETQNVTDVGPHKIIFENNESAMLYNFGNHKFAEFVNHQEDWAGLSHFNQVGASRFTEELIRYFTNQDPLFVNEIEKSIQELN